MFQAPVVGYPHIYNSQVREGHFTHSKGGNVQALLTVWSMEQLGIDVSTKGGGFTPTEAGTALLQHSVTVDLPIAYC